MSILAWDEVGKKFYETGVSKGVLYVQNINGTYPLGVPWNGLISVSESPSGAEANPQYADNIKYINLFSTEEFAATIEAYTYPDEFAECDGSASLGLGAAIGQQSRKPFGLSYKTVLGNDVANDEYGYKIHLVYGCTASPSEKAYQTINDSPEAIALSWEVTTVPVPVTGFKPTATLVIDSTKISAELLSTIEDILYGTAGTDARLPLPDEIAALIAAGAPSAIALSTIVPADEATGISVDANVVLTFNNKIQNEAITVASAAGGIVAGAKSWDTAGKVLTFNPTGSLTAGTTYIVTVAGVSDIYGQALATEVKNFATSA